MSVVRSKTRKLERPGAQERQNSLRRLADYNLYRKDPIEELYRVLSHSLR